MKDFDIPEPKYDNYRVDLARVDKEPEIKLSRGFMLTVSARFNYETGIGTQGVGGYYADGNFIESFIKVFGEKKLKNCTGTLWVEHKNDSVARLIPLGVKNGKEFDIKEWSETLKEKQKEEE